MNIKDIAKATGVSSATVSRVINNSGYVKEDTRKKIMKVINDNNYIPSAVARSLSIQDTASIGVIIPDIENPFFSSVIRGISDVAEKNNYNILFFGTNENQAIEHSYLKTVQGQRLKGVIITPISENDMETREYLIRLNNSGVPVVLVDRSIRDTEFDGVFIDNIQSAYEGVESLIHAGHKKIAIITGPETSKPGKERLLGYKKAMKAYKLDVLDKYIAQGDFKVEKAYKRTKELLELSMPPTAIFTSNNLTTLGCLKYLTEKNLEIGKDLSIMGFDDIETLKMIDFKLSVIDRDAKLQGQEAMKLLIERLENKNYQSEFKKIILPHSVILRGSEQIIKLI
ncbi:LacI family transcriptional regulator [Petrocella atlantisensis]|uniref:LacI family transcriptional regulator n=1 Tax=Petrocella atlantisensis TaxID=2173034 RepID=A0A3P7P992_9FIRM|nr:LacI family DNA-binding transcriptional regulator [Petrocella atlantisensis]VDN46753.1 LacI family transcriptional regulator [Petrocella atlantisensis]